MLEGFGNIFDAAQELFQGILDALVSVFLALQDFNTMLGDFDYRIQQMTASCGSSEFTGMPIVDAIGTFRYLVGDLAFYMIYITVLIGCLLTIYKLVVLIFDAISSLLENVTGGASKGALGRLVNKIFT